MRCSRASTTVITMTSEPTLSAELSMSRMPIANMERMNAARSAPFVTSTHSDHHHSRRCATRWWLTYSLMCPFSYSTSPEARTASMFDVLSTICPRSCDDDSAYLKLNRWRRETKSTFSGM
jgi:hypothetical protein